MKQRLSTMDWFLDYLLQYIFKSETNLITAPDALLNYQK